MFLPIILDPFAFGYNRYAWQVQKYLYHCYQNRWPLISQGRFEKNRNLYSEEFQALHEFEWLDEDRFAQVETYFIPEQLFLDLSEDKGSRLAAQLFLLSNRYPPLEEYLEDFIRQIEENNLEPVEGILNWAAHFESVKYVAKQHGIPIITNEFCLRFPNYRSLGFLCFGDIYDEETIVRRYQAFADRLSGLPVEPFSQEELLALFLSDSMLDSIRLFRMKPQFEMGVGGCHPLVTTFFAKSMFTDLELTQNIRGQYTEDEILFRKHPGDEPYQATYGFKNQDASETAIHFLLQCKRLAAQGSNLLLEGMLWGKPVYSHDVSPFAPFCEHDFSNKGAQPVSADVLNFILFSYLAPIEKLWEEDYLRWRLTDPGENDIFRRHLEFYLTERNLTLKDVAVKGGRLKRILQQRGI